MRHCRSLHQVHQKADKNRIMSDTFSDIVVNFVPAVAFASPSCGQCVEIVCYSSSLRMSSYWLYYSTLNFITSERSFLQLP